MRASIVQRIQILNLR